LRLHGWVYKLETGEVFAFDPVVGQFLPVLDHMSGAKTVLPRIGVSP
jgi:carbonic anhydrase